MCGESKTITLQITFSVSVVGFGKTKCIYPDLPSSRAPVSHKESLSVPYPQHNFLSNNESESDVEGSLESSDADCAFGAKESNAGQI